MKDLLRAAYAMALCSPDLSTQNGALVLDRDGNIIGAGCNEFTHGMTVRPEMLERPTKYAYIEHAERNALYSTLRHGGGVPHTLVCPWAACADCARAIVQSGVRRLVRHQADPSSWDESIAVGDEMMTAAGVEIVTVQGPLGGCDPTLRNGQRWVP